MTDKIMLEDDEYINQEDGLVWCRKCHTPRQIRKEMWGKIRTLRVPCDCQKEEWKAEKHRRKEEERLRRVDRLKEGALGWSGLKCMCFDQDDGHNPSLMERIKNYTRTLENGQKTGVLFWGPPGTGKTFAAACIINACLDKEVSAAMFSFRQIIMQAEGLSFEERNTFLDGLFQKKILCLDGFDLNYHTNQSLDILLDLAGRIDRAEMPVLLTTNYTLQELGHPKGKIEEYVFPIILSKLVPMKTDGPDMRKEKSKEQYKQLQEQCRTSVNEEIRDESSD